MEKIDLERNIELQKRLDQHNKNNRLLWVIVIVTHSALLIIDSFILYILDYFILLESNIFISKTTKFFKILAVKIGMSIWTFWINQMFRPERSSKSWKKQNINFKNLKLVWSIYQQHTKHFRKKRKLSKRPFLRFQARVQK